jgi:hypothetical protein
LECGSGHHATILDPTGTPPPSKGHAHGGRRPRCPTDGPILTGRNAGPTR